MTPTVTRFPIAGISTATAYTTIRGRASEPHLRRPGSPPVRLKVRRSGRGRHRPSDDQRRATTGGCQLQRCSRWVCVLRGHRVAPRRRGHRGLRSRGDDVSPTESVTRGQMAAFLVRYLGLTDPGPGDWFVDDDGSLFESEIDRLAQAGITLGCNPPSNDQFCPLESVTRGQMATFLDRVLDLPSAPSFGFTDINDLGAPRRHQPSCRRRDHPGLRRHLVLPRPGGDPRPDGGLPPPRRRVPLNRSNPGFETAQRTLRPTERARRTGSPGCGNRRSG